MNNNNRQLSKDFFYAGYTVFAVDSDDGEFE